MGLGMIGGVSEIQGTDPSECSKQEKNWRKNNSSEKSR